MIPLTDHQPKAKGYYLVWVPTWEGYDNKPHYDYCYWDGEAFSDGVFPSVDDGAPVTHWVALPPEGPETAGSLFAALERISLDKHVCTECKHTWMDNSATPTACPECGETESCYTLGVPFIVKVQVSLFDSKNRTMMQIYDERHRTSEKKWGIEYQAPLTDEVAEQMQGRVKAYFWVMLAEDINGGIQVIMGEEAPEQEW